MTATSREITLSFRARPKAGRGRFERTGSITGGKALAGAWGVIYPPLMAVTPSYAHLEDEVLHLSREERSLLASKLLESLDDDDGFELAPEWNEELQRRAKEIDEGKAKMIPHANVLAQVKARLAEVRSERQ
jgi:putative addiction module component (TIGR02574 family)